MDTTCPSCNYLTELPDSLEPGESGATCSTCRANLFFEYRYCGNCKVQYLKELISCPECDFAIEPTPIVSETKYKAITNQADYLEAVGFIESQDLLALDTEGTSLDPFTNELLLIQIGNARIVYIFDYIWHDALAHESFWQDERKLFILHNAKFDYKVLKQSSGITLMNIFDTMLAERVLTCGLYRRNALSEVAEKYLERTLDKSIRMEFTEMSKETLHNKLTRELLQYAAKDVQILPIIYEIQYDLLHKQNLLSVAELEFEVCKLVAEIELKGIYIDVKAWRRIMESAAVQKARCEDNIHNYLIDNGFKTDLLAGLHLKLNSPKVLKEIFNKLGVEVNSTSDEELSAVKHPLVELIKEFRQYDKQLSSFGEKFLAHVKSETSRIHPSFNQIGADTGRFSCTKPNLQQIPSSEEYRSCFAAPPGRVIIACDYSQQELRVLASLSKDKKFIEFYEQGVDLHTATASMMFNIPLEKVEKDTHRKIAKTINFGLAYGQGARKLGLTIGVDENEANQMIEKYFSQFTNIRDWLKQAAEGAQLNGYSTTLLGRKRFYSLPDPNSVEYKQKLSAIGRQGKNSPIQGSGADMVKLALLLIDKCLREKQLDAFIINIVHDEIIVEAATKDADEAAEIVKNSMEEAGRQLASNVPIVAELAIGDHWKH